MNTEQRNSSEQDSQINHRLPLSPPLIITSQLQPGKTDRGFSSLDKLSCHSLSGTAHWVLAVARPAHSVGAWEKDLTD